MMAELRRGMGRTNRPLVLVLMPDVPIEVPALLAAAGHITHDYADLVRSSITLSKVDAVVGQRCWRFPETWWVKDGALSPYVKVMLKAIQTQVYPAVAKAKKGKR